MHAAMNCKLKHVELMPIEMHISKRLIHHVAGLMSVFLMLLLGACSPQPVYKTVAAPKIQVPSELTSQLDRPNCLFKSNANLGDCILQQAGVIDRANADREAIRRILEKQ